MIRSGRKYTLEEILLLIEKSRRTKRIELDGDLVKISSDRLVVFKHSVVCSLCGIMGSFFVKEKSTPNEAFHLNLYAINDFGDEILMTKDHIIPRSLGGKNHISNYQTMCLKCNLEKGNGIQKGSYKKNK